MYLSYLDESGNRSLKREGFFVLCSLSIGEHSWKSLSTKIHELLAQFELPKDTNLKHLRRIKYENTHLSRLSQEDLQTLSRSIYDFLKEEISVIHAVVIDKKKLKDKYEKPQDPYTLAYAFLLERIDFYLQRNKHYGIIILYLTS